MRGPLEVLSQAMKIRLKVISAITQFKILLLQRKTTNVGSEVSRLRDSPSLYMCDNVTLEEKKGDSL